MSQTKESNKVARGRGRPVTVGVADQIRLPLPAGLKERVQAVLKDGETVVGFFRDQAERELRRRERTA